MTLFDYTSTRAKVRSLILRWLAATLLCCGLPAVASAEGAGEPGLAAIEHRAGRFESALGHWEAALRQARAAADVEDEARAQFGAAQAYLALGRASLATRRLEAADELAGRLGNAALRGPILAALGNAQALAGDAARARATQTRAIALGRADPGGDVLARATNDLARLEALAGNLGRAAELYRQAMASAGASGNAALEATAAVNLARLPLPADARAQALTRAEALARALPESHPRALALTSVGRLREAGVDPSAAPAAIRDQAASVYEEAAATARALDDQRLLSYALGYRAALDEQSNQPVPALALTRQAAAAARRANAPESLYRWEWQAGRLLRQLGDEAAALTAYRVAANTLERIRADLAAGGRASFRAEAGPVYLGLVDLLLRRAERAGDAQTDLREARRTMEALKGAELEDFFQDDCVAALKSKTSGIDALAPHTAALYPIVLPDRLALLVSFPEGLRVYTSPVAVRDLEAETRALRRKMEKRTTREYLRHARQLYDWVVRPARADLDRADIKTLVFVPDGMLRTIPLAALHDGKAHLAERYAVATSPGLTLTDPRPLAAVTPRVLLAGLTEPVQGFAALPGVKKEIEEIAALLPGTVLLDETFLSARFRDDLAARPYTIVHVASHGEFGSSAQETFLLTKDSRINLNELEGLLGGTAYRKQPVELLALSACQTAAGDDRAALGLAGVAVKAGARSALATLWSVSDDATRLLVSDFYRHLGGVGMNKAEALREAQKALLADRRYRHPYYWSPFLLIGNWL